MGNTANLENWAARERMRMIEVLLWWRGWIGRGDLTEAFGISAAQASGDLQRYLELNPEAMRYHTSRKRYEASPEMCCVRHEPRLEEALALFFGLEGRARATCLKTDGLAKVGSVSLPVRDAGAQVERRLVMALLAGAACRVHYHSMHSGKEGWRELVPGAFGWDGRRWHLRAFEYEHGEWRDYVLGRMSRVEWPGEKVENLPPDEDWERFEEVVLRLNPDLDESRKAGLRLDYGMKGDELRMEVRAAMTRYFMAEMFLTEEGESSPRHFVMVR